MTGIYNNGPSDSADYHERQAEQARDDRGEPRYVVPNGLPPLPIVEAESEEKKEERREDHH